MNIVFWKEDLYKANSYNEEMIYSSRKDKEFQGGFINSRKKKRIIKFDVAILKKPLTLVTTK